MTTTQTEPPDSPAAPGPPRGPARRVPVLGGVAAGLVIALLALAFGGYTALLALPAVWPRLRRLRPFSFALLGGVILVVSVTWLAGNPLAAYAREQALDRLEAGLGERPTYDSFEWDAPRGELVFRGLSCGLPDLDGSLDLEVLTFHLGYGYLVRFGPVRVGGRGLRFAGEGGTGGEGFKRWAKRLEGLEGATDLEVNIKEDCLLVIRGDEISGYAEVTLLGATDDDGRFGLNLGIDRLLLTVLGQDHDFAAVGGITIRQGRKGSGGGYEFSSEMRLVERGGAAGLMISGTLRPDFESPGGLKVVIDTFQLEPFWAKYRKVDRWKAAVRGEVHVAGTLSELRLRPDLVITAMDYNNFALMAADGSENFLLPSATLMGELVIRGGETLEFRKVVLDAPGCTLATKQEMRAKGDAQVSLSGVWPELKGSVTAVVKSGAIRQDISWATHILSGLKDIRPDTVDLGEQFPSLDLSLSIEVERLDLACDPLYGYLTGRLTGRFQKLASSKTARIGLEGKLELKEGRFEFLSAKGEVTGTVEFRANAAVANAVLRGELSGAVGETALRAQITGRISAPGFIFKGVQMSPDKLGSLIVTHGEEGMTQLQKANRRNTLARLCGIAALSTLNPFRAGGRGRVFFSFRAGD